MKRFGLWLAVLAVLVLLVAACGPEMDSPTPGDEVAEAPATVAQEEGPTEESIDEPTDEPSDEPTEKPADQPTEEAAEPTAANPETVDWHVLGSPDAPVTMVEYSDFQ
ncbi:hypothetical protein ACFLWA_07645 [Chloroflexota bacterium]